MLKEINSQDRENQKYGYASDILARFQKLESNINDTDRLNNMKVIAEEAIVIFGSRILDFLNQELLDLLNPDDLERLEKEHIWFISQNPKLNNDLKDAPDHWHI